MIQSKLEWIKTTLSKGEDKMNNKIIYIFMVLFLVSCGSDKTSIFSTNSAKGVSSPKVTVQSILSELDKGKYKEAELLVKFKPTVTATTSSAVNSAIGASLVKSYSSVINLQHVKLPASLSVKDAIIRYMADPNVEYAEPNYLLSPSSTTPNDTFFNPQQWPLRNTGAYASGTATADIKATDAWDISRGSSSVVIAVLDTGIDYTHPDLVGNIWTNPGETGTDAFGHDKRTNGIDDDGDGKVDDWRGWNFLFVDKNENGVCDQFPEDPFNNENCNDPLDDVGHGTHVAGIIGAVGNNGLGISGLMWNVQLMALKVCNEVCPIDAILGGIEYAVSKNAKVINASFGGPVFSSSLQSAISAANTAGVLFVASAGNEGINTDISPSYPSGFNLPNIISVAATDQNDARASFSNFGPSSVHVAAPGVYVLSTVPFVDLGFPYEGFILLQSGYAFFDGTSMAAPHVSGLAGLLYSFYDGIHNTQFTYWQVRDAILWSVDHLPTLEGSIMTGGRINAYRALSSLLTPTGLTAAAISPSQISLTWSGNATGEEEYVVERRTGSESFQWLINVPRIARENVIPQPPVTYTFVDTNLPASTSYTYRVKARTNKIGCTPLHGTCSPGNSFYSNEASATTLASGDPAPVASSSDGGGGGGCSIGARQNAPTAMADLAALLMPLVLVAILRRRR